jgi:hypothetical protein
MRVSSSPFPDRVDHVFDPTRTRGLLYISTSSGRIQRYDIESRRLLRQFRVGSDLRGLDITPDRAGIYATEYIHGAQAGVLHKVSLIVYAHIEGVESEPRVGFRRVQCPK